MTRPNATKADDNHNQEPSHGQDKDEDAVHEIWPRIVQEVHMFARGRGDEGEKTT